MKYHLVRIDPLPAARVAAVLYLLMGLVVLPFLYYDFVLTPERLGFSKLVVLLIPPLVAGIAFASTALGCVIYNWLAGKMGGLEVELDQGGPE